MNSIRLSGSTVCGDVLGRDDRPLDDEHVEARLYRRPVVLLHALGREGGGGDDALVLYLLDAPEDKLFLDGLGVEFLHDPGGLVLGEARYLFEDGSRVLVARLYAFQVEHREPAQRPDDPRRHVGSTAASSALARHGRSK